MDVKFHYCDDPECAYCPAHKPEPHLGRDCQAMIERLEKECTRLSMRNTDLEHDLYLANERINQLSNDHFGAVTAMRELAKELVRVLK